MTLEVDMAAVPKRTEERRRRNKTERGVPVPSVERAPGAEVVEVPEADPDWHPIAAEWFRSLGLSGQRRWYEPSDWARARYVAQGMSENLRSGRFSAQLFAAVNAAAVELLDTEGSRRRLRIELERAAVVDTDEDASVTALDRYRARLDA